MKNFAKTRLHSSARFSLMALVGLALVGGAAVVQSMGLSFDSRSDAMKMGSETDFSHRVLAGTPDLNR
jgi:hypothetical protein